MSKEIADKNEQTQILAMLGLMAEKFIFNAEMLAKLKGLINVGVIFDMIWDDALEVASKEFSIEVAKKMLANGEPIKNTSLVKNR